MTTKVFIYIDNEWQELKLYNNVETDERLDEQLDSVSMQIISENSRSFADFSMIKIIRIDIDGEEEKAYFYGFDTVEKRMGNYYIHSFELIEPSRKLMGVLIDGLAVVQPVGNEEKTSIRSVLRRLLRSCNLLTVEEEAYQEYELVASNHPKFDEHLSELMGEEASPEFNWQAQTTLWECLCDIGNVINCIPRLTANKKETKFDAIYFERINDITAEYTI